jgi:hypothetical protein
MATSEHDVPRGMSVEEFRRIPESDRFLYELSAGVLDRSLTLGSEQTLDGGDVLPGFRLDVAQLFRF